MMARAPVDTPLGRDPVRMPRILSAAALGAALGLLGAKATELGAWTLLPWAVGAAGVHPLVRKPIPPPKRSSNA